MAMDMPDNWLPTPENINALPEPLRQYVHDLETRCDPGGDVSRMALLQDQNEQLQARVDELEAERDELEAQAERLEEVTSRAHYDAQRASEQAQTQREIAQDERDRAYEIEREAGRKRRHGEWSGIL